MKYSIPALQAFSQDFFSQLTHVSSEDDLEQIRRAYLGRKGQLADLKTQLKQLPPEKRKSFGQELNILKTRVMQAFTEKESSLRNALEKQKVDKDKYFDVTQYLSASFKGGLHPYTSITQKIEDVFMSLGFDIVDGPEVESDYHNFEVLNIPADHPEREMFDTFWLDIPNMLLRTHTSTVQSRIMHNQQPPLAIAAPGRCYRYEATDASHDFMFMQCECLMIGKDISMAHLLGTIKEFFQGIFKDTAINIRIRPSYFPFVEPGIEVDITCPFCTNGCSVCKQTKWIEAGGAGLVHPNVLRSGGIDPQEFSGFAFGFGLTRLTMLKYKINDIRLLHGGKMSFLKQF